MGQAAVDLPDTPNPAIDSASTDDLLAQMAGEEIDRLLAEANGEAPPPAAAAPIAPRVETPSTPVASTPQASEADQLGGLLEGISTDSGSDPVAELAGLSNVPAKGQAAGELRADPLLDEETSAAAERGALNAPRGALLNIDGTTHTPTPPAALRVLSWINTPVQSCPDSVREAIGKVAILTAVNAISVFAYVLFFRHH